MARRRRWKQARSSNNSPQVTPEADDVQYDGIDDTADTAAQGSDETAVEAVVEAGDDTGEGADNHAAGEAEDAPPAEGQDATVDGAQDHAADEAEDAPPAEGQDATVDIAQDHTAGEAEDAPATEARAAASPEPAAEPSVEAGEPAPAVVTNADEERTADEPPEPPAAAADVADQQTANPHETQSQQAAGRGSTGPTQPAVEDEPLGAPAQVGASPAPDHVVPLEASPAAYDQTKPGDSVGPANGVAAWRRLLLVGRPRATKANLLAAILAVALGVGIATQVQLTNERGLSELSQTDLVRVLDDISLRSSQLDEHIHELETTRDRLRSGTDTTAEALSQAQHRLDTLGILAGTVAAEGPGITVDISDPDRQVTGPLILDLIQELRDAGAESIQVGGVRVVASTFIGDDGGNLSVDGTAITRPIHIKAIGDSNTLSSAMTIPGGIVETIRQKGARASVNEAPSVKITAVHKPRPLTHARPSE